MMRRVMFTHAYTIGRPAGIPVRVHVTVLALLPLVLIQFPPSQWGLALLAAAGVMASIVLHELGHAWAARRLGCRAREIVLLPVGGVASIERMPAGPRGEIVLAAAGPAVSLALALLLHVAAGALGRTGARDLSLWAGFLGHANLLLGLFNLIPSFPMDGGRILRAALAPYLGRLLATKATAFLGRAIAVVIGLSALMARPVNVWNLALAVFLFVLAGAEEQQSVAEEIDRLSGRAGPDPGPGSARRVAGRRGGMKDVTDEVEVSPPPYARKGTAGAADRFRRWIERLRHPR